MSRVIRAGIVVSFLLWAPTLPGQECGPDEVTPWWPRVHNPHRDASAADVAADATLAAIEALVRKTNYAKPRGFAVRPWWSHGREVGGATGLRSFELDIVSFARCNKFDEHGADLMVFVNPDPQFWSEGDRPLLDEAGDAFYSERLRTEKLLGATAAYGHFEEVNGEGQFLLFTRDGESPTLPVTREAYLRAIIFTLEGKNQERKKDALAATTKTKYERWLEDAPGRKKRNAEILEGVAIGNPAKLAEVRASLEKADRVAEETLRKEHAAERIELDKMRNAVAAPGDRMRAQIAAMTPDERSAPTWLVGDDLVPDGTPGAMAIVRRNPAFYRFRRSPTEVRAILVRLPNVYEEFREQHAELFRQFDWAALRGLLVR